MPRTLSRFIRQSPRSASLFLLIISAGAAAGPPRAHAPATHEVRMVGDAKRARFEPAEVSASAGDDVVFIVVSGQPHNVAFDTTALSAARKQALRPRIHDEMLPFAGPLLLAGGNRYVVSTAGLPSGTYPFFCMTHLALNMRGTLIVK